MADQVKFFEHPEYSELRPKWQKYKDLYEGDHTTLATNYDYLWPHELELVRTPDPHIEGGTIGGRLRGTRVRRSRFPNFMEPVISNFIALAFKGMSVHASTENMLGEEINDIDGDGTTLEDFIKTKVMVPYFMYSRPIILVDAPENTAVSRKEEVEGGFRPYFQAIDPLEAPDWQKTSLSQNLLWLRNEYKLLEDRESPTQEPTISLYSKVLILDGGVYAIRKYKSEKGKESADWELVDERFVPEFEEIPVAAHFKGESWIKDVAEWQMVVFNLFSAYFSQLNGQAFQRVVFIGDLSEQNKIALSEYSGITLPAGSDVKWIEPSDTSALQIAIEGSINHLYRIAFNQTRALSSASKEAPGAETIREMKEELIALLVSALTEIESVVNTAIRHYARFKGTKDFEEGITLNKDITDEDISLQLEEWASYRDQILKILPWKKAELKKVARRRRYSEDELDEINDEIDKLKEEEPMDPFGDINRFAKMNGQLNGQGEEEGNGPGEGTRGPGGGFGAKAGPAPRDEAQ